MTTLAALVSCAILVSDYLHPGRAFCPLAEACAQAASSPLGSILGVPTAAIGLAAFGAFFLLTLLPISPARGLVRPAGLLAGAAGAVFIAYQALVLQTFCPMCLVADVAGILVGLAALTWPQPPVRLSGRPLPGEGGGPRIAWTMVAILAVLIPFAWPRPEEPSWVEITPLAELEPDLLAEETTGSEVTEPVVEPEAEESPFRIFPHEAMMSVAPSDGAAAAGAHEDPSALATPAATTPSTPRAPARSAQPTGPLVIEYLNAFCPHCRATYYRLEKLLAESGTPVRRRRIYTWASNDYPLWARACAYAQTVGREEQMFEELLKARSQHASEIYAAAQRAGLDVQALQQAVRQRTPPARLVRDRRLTQAARLRMLPTLDIGRRRLMGEQSEAELRVALRAASNTR
ncbi:MAG: vitamin K epoxide reductase family protein [Planctomycetota bacterium]